jgi:hypothetical protein
MLRSAAASSSQVGSTISTRSRASSGLSGSGRGRSPLGGFGGRVVPRMSGRLARPVGAVGSTSLLGQTVLSEKRGERSVEPRPSEAAPPRAEAKPLRPSPRQGALRFSLVRHTGGAGHNLRRSLAKRVFLASHPRFAGPSPPPSAFPCRLRVLRWG